MRITTKVWTKVWIHRLQEPRATHWRGREWVSVVAEGASQNRELWIVEISFWERRTRARYTGETRSLYLENYYLPLRVVEPTPNSRSLGSLSVMVDAWFFTWATSIRIFWVRVLSRGASHIYDILRVRNMKNNVLPEESPPGQARPFTYIHTHPLLLREK